EQNPLRGPHSQWLDLAIRGRLVQYPARNADRTPKEPAVYAIIEDSGTQIRVAPGDILEVDLRDGGKAGSAITFDRVLLIGDEESEATATVGLPYVEGASVTGEVVDQIKGEKIDVIKYKRRKGF